MTKPLDRFTKAERKRNRTKFYTKQWAIKKFQGKDIQNYDIDSKIDSYISVEENKTILLPEIKSQFGFNYCLSNSDVRSCMLPFGSDLPSNDKIRCKVFKNLILLKEKGIKDIPTIMQTLRLNQRRTAYDYLYTMKELGLIK